MVLRDVQIAPLSSAFDPCLERVSEQNEFSGKVNEVLIDSAAVVRVDNAA